MKSARSPEPLLGTQLMSGVAGTKMCGTIPEARNHVIDALGRHDYSRIAIIALIELSATHHLRFPSGD